MFMHWWLLRIICRTTKFSADVQVEELFSPVNNFQNLRTLSQNLTELCLSKNETKTSLNVNEAPTCMTQRFLLLKR